MAEFEKRFTEIIKNLSIAQGADSLTGQIFAILYLEPGKISMEEIAKRTGYSLASISNKIKLLETGGLIKKTKEPGSKKIYLYMEKDLLKILEEGIEKKQRLVINMVKSEIPGIIEDARPADEKEKAKLESIKKYHKTILKFEKALEIIHKEIKKI